MGYAARVLTFEDATAKPEQARIRPLQKPVQKPARLVANDTLYGELESRYGGGFAQWVVDWVARTEG